MEKIFNAYAERKGVQPGALRFLMDGARITAEQTPKMVRSFALSMSTFSVAVMTLIHWNTCIVGIGRSRPNRLPFRASRRTALSLPF